MCGEIGKRCGHVFHAEFRQPWWRFPAACCNLPTGNVCFKVSFPLDVKSGNLIFHYVPLFQRLILDSLDLSQLLIPPGGTCGCCKQLVLISLQVAGAE